MDFVNRNGRIKTLKWHLEQSVRAQSVRIREHFQNEFDFKTKM